MELTTAIQSEQHVKKELARRMGELQEDLHNVKEQVWSRALISIYITHNVFSVTHMQSSVNFILSSHIL